MIHLDIRAEGMQSIIDTLQPTGKQADKALKRTVARMAKWLSTRTVRGLGKELQLTQKIIRRRLKKSKVVTVNGGYSIRLFYGLNDVALIHLNARQTKTGVTASKRQVKSAFISKSKHQVFKRTSKARLPLQKQVDVIKSKADTYIESSEFNSSQFEAQFYKNLEHELKWQMKWMG